MEGWGWVIKSGVKYLASVVLIHPPPLHIVVSGKGAEPRKPYVKPAGVRGGRGAAVRSGCEERMRAAGTARASEMTRWDDGGRGLPPRHAHRARRRPRKGLEAGP